MGPRDKGRHGFNKQRHLGGLVGAVRDQQGCRRLWRKGNFRDQMAMRDRPGVKRVGGPIGQKGLHRLGRAIRDKIDLHQLGNRDVMRHPPLARIGRRAFQPDPHPIARPPEAEVDQVAWHRLEQSIGLCGKHILQRQCAAFVGECAGIGTEIERKFRGIRKMRDLAVVQILRRGRHCEKQEKEKQHRHATHRLTLQRGIAQRQAGTPQPGCPVQHLEFPMKFHARPSNEVFPSFRSIAALGYTKAS